MEQYICIDIGGTAIKYGLLDEQAQILERHSIPAEGQKGGAQLLRKTLDIVRKYRSEAVGVCLSSAGMVDIVRGEIFYAGPTIPDFAGTRFRAAVQETFGLPCEIENDVNCAGLAEARSGAGQGASSMLCLTVGTGIGGCFVVDGRVWHGFSNSACEVGYMHMPGGNFQEIGANSVMVGELRRRKKATEREWGGRRIFDAARAGDADCIEVIDRMVDALGMGMANICYVLNPELIVLGGGVMQQEEYLYPRLRKALEKYLTDAVASRTKLAFAAYRNSAGMIGALYHFRDMQARRAEGEFKS